MEKDFKKPELTIILFSEEDDIITTSSFDEYGEGGGLGGED